ncbi:MAG: hypothetical protein AAF766_23350 [Cyanobacteria bacterium P01_D01_bin.14]
MAIYLEPRDSIADLEGFNSVLIVSCPTCPQISLAMQKQKPLFEFFKGGFKTGAFEDYVSSIRESLEQRGVRTGVYTTRLPSPLMCLWTEGQRNRLLQRAKDYEAVLVLGCVSATDTVKDALKEIDCQVFQGMKMKGISNATVKFEFPLTVKLEVNPLHGAGKTRQQEDVIK